MGLFTELTAIDLSPRRRNNMLAYLASPFSHPDHHVRHNRWALACHACADLIKSGIHCISPIAASYHVALSGDIDGCYETWREIDRKLLRRCDSLIVLCIDGWDRSAGVADELQYAKELGLPISYYTRKTGITLTPPPKE